MKLRGCFENTHLSCWCILFDDGRAWRVQRSMSEGQQGVVSVSAGEGETQLVTVEQLQVSAAGQVVTTGGPTMAVVQLPGGQTVQVQSVIQAAQPSVIQSPQIQTIQVAAISEEAADGSAISQKRREILSRRPSYRKILNDLSSDGPVVSKIDEEKSEEEGTATISTVTLPTPIYQTSTGQYIAIAQGGAIQIANGAEGLQALTMTNTGNQQGGATIVQYAQTSDGQQFFVPGSQVVVQSASGETYQIRTPTSGLSQGVVVSASPGGLASPQGGAEESTRKREIRLYKNREAARECRRKKKEYVKCLENRVAVLENQNKTLIEELKTLKDLYCHKND
ncbi:cyclic AMP-responsive element-binding protein 1-like isoform X1 [Petromyzon marinus]|uniref:Cyclic AMP-responsive element-binding protein 1-like isoform X1 n=3 Tax=Petromyzon marinus TaxID=7757 RepID=A0AAJ7X0M0_PETMA|nr:cyclic AMP-responsive element-binding protein 1-like isoform X1 [Petromyzon marinus]